MTLVAKLSIYLSVVLSVYLSIYLSIYLFMSLCYSDFSVSPVGQSERVDKRCDDVYTYFVVS